jgi:hypothetical protein
LDGAVKKTRRTFFKNITKGREAKDNLSSTSLRKG